MEAEWWPVGLLGQLFHDQPIANRNFYSYIDTS